MEVVKSAEVHDGETSNSFDLVNQLARGRATFKTSPSAFNSKMKWNVDEMDLLFGIYFSKSKFMVDWLNWLILISKRNRSVLWWMKIHRCIFGIRVTRIVTPRNMIWSYRVDAMFYFDR